MRTVIVIIVSITALLGAAFMVLRTPDTDPATMFVKYGGSGAQFVDGPGGIRLHVRDNGGPDKPAVMLLHGANASLHTWEPIIEALLDDYRLIAFDRRGHGLTGPHPQDDYSTSGMLDEISAVADALGVQRFAIVGHSAGGGLAWRYALDHPERVAALGLLNASGAPRDAEAPKPSSNIGFRLMSSGAGRFLLERITPRFLIRQSLEQSVAVTAIVDDAMVDRYWELLRYPGNRRATVLHSLADRGPPMAGRLGELSVPTLVLWGREDRLIPVADATKFAELIDGARLVVLDGVGHIPMEEVPDETAAALKALLDGASF